MVRNVILILAFSTGRDHNEQLSTCLQPACHLTASESQGFFPPRIIVHKYLDSAKKCVIFLQNSDFIMEGSSATSIEKYF